jgi:hypothetical protein
VRAFVAALLALPLLACAAHNSHRVPIDLNAQLAPLIDEAWTRMEERWSEPIPVGGVSAAVEVEPVEVQWLPYSAEVPPGGSTIDQAELRRYVEEALRVQAPPNGANAERVVRVELVTDLHAPDSLGLRVECALVAAGAPRVALARGKSGCLRFERLYCHGCRDRWTGLGTELPDETGPPEATVADDTDDGGWIGIFFPPSSPGSGPGYTKH